MWDAKLFMGWRTLGLGELMEGSSWPGDPLALCMRECPPQADRSPGTPVSRVSPAAWGPGSPPRDCCQSIPPAAGTQHLFARWRDNAATAPLPGFPVGCGEKWSSATGDTQMGQDLEKLSWSRALSRGHFGSIRATWAHLVLKTFKLHLKALKCLLSPCLIALKAFKPLLLDNKPRGAKSLVPVGLWVLPVGPAGTRLPCLGGRGERAAAGTSGGDRGDGPPMPRGTVCPHLFRLRAPSCSQVLPSSLGA